MDAKRGDQPSHVVAKLQCMQEPHAMRGSEDAPPLKLTRQIQRAHNTGFSVRRTPKKILVEGT